MARILVLGGYGGFGGRISRRLAREGREVLVAGRSLSRAEAFCADNARLRPLAMDRAAIARAIAAHDPAIVVDASGPFQAMDLAVPRACIASGVHYCDIADSTAFVRAIASLDDAARAAGVTVLSGASSVPALSGAVVRELSAGMERVAKVEMAISASNQASAGASVAAAILQQIGKPFALRRHGRAEVAHGWQDMQRIDFTVPGRAPIRRRTVALTDVPDLTLLPGRLPGEPAVTFHAGGELAFQNVALWLLSWPVRWRWIRGIGGFARWLRPLQRLTAWAGSDRSAMRVRMFGIVAARRVERCWTLIAERGDGPEIPTLAIAPLVARILAGQEQTGARDAGEALALADYEQAFAGLAVAQAVEERELAEPLYRRVMGARFDRLPPVLRAMHSVLREGGADGEAEVSGARSPVGALIARIVGFPPPGRHRLHVSFVEHEHGEVWTRQFGRRAFASHLGESGGRLTERFGPMRFHFDLPSDGTGLAMEIRRWTVFGVPMPMVLAPRSRAREWEEDGRFHFDVPIALPLIGRVVHYRGWLNPPQ